MTRPIEEIVAEAQEIAGRRRRKRITVLIWQAFRAGHAAATTFPPGRYEYDDDGVPQRPRREPSGGF
jgi:hypothetical protein